MIMTRLARIAAPYPYFGGKSKIAPHVWTRLGADVKLYIEPFFGSGAVLLNRPAMPDRAIERVNDLDGYIVNFWRAVQSDPAQVARYAVNPVFENDLHARHAWLVQQRAKLTYRLEGDTDYFDAKIAGWWVWGMANWIGGGFCSGAGPWQVVDGELRPHAGDNGQGVQRQRPHAGDSGQGVQRQLPHAGDNGRGVQRQLPHAGNNGQGVHAYLEALAARFATVQVFCGDYARLLTPSVCWGANPNENTVTAVFLDPPYPEQNRDLVYNHETNVDAAVRAWCLDNGDNPNLRIAYCTYSGPDSETRFLAAGWDAYRWKGHSGYSAHRVNGVNLNRHREVVWFSPHCLQAVKQPTLF